MENILEIMIMKKKIKKKLLWKRLNHMDLIIFMKKYLYL